MITMFTATDKKCRIILHFLSENERRLKELAERKKNRNDSERIQFLGFFFPSFSSAERNRSP